MSKVAFASKAWEGDWHKLVYSGFDNKKDVIGYPFSESTLVLNNGVPKSIAGYHVDENAKELLTFFDLTFDDFNGGYNYSIGELAAIYLAKNADYLCYVQGDCFCKSGDWVTEGVAILESNLDISVVSPASEVNTWHNSKGLDQYFSDQAWLVRVKEFRQPIYEGGEDIPDYPEHGGDSFEKKVAQYLRANNKYRKILTNHWYEHPAYE